MIRSFLCSAAAVVFTACGPIDPGRDGGFDAGMDGGKPDSGTGILPTTCVSNMKWTAGNVGSEAMNPGLACRSCHLGQNFLGQNPNGDTNPQWAMFFMGTAYGGFNEQNLCHASAVPAGAVVEILDMNGVLKHTLTIDPMSGNFRSNSVDAQMTLPYRARIRANGQIRVMGATQMNGDCNVCHTEQGLEGAPGRIIWP